MKILEKVHEDWIPIIRTYLHQEPLSILINEILPNISYKPEKENIFNVFTMPLKDIKIIILHLEPYPYYTNNIRNFSKWEKQGVFILNTSLTSEVSNMENHYDYWENLIKTIIRYISKQHPCIWLIPNIRNEMKFKNCIIHNPFFVEGYDKELIENIPINSDWNYIFTTFGKEDSENNYYYANSILKQMNNKEIKW